MPYQTDHTHHTSPYIPNTIPYPHHTTGGEGDGTTPPPHHRGGLPPGGRSHMEAVYGTHPIGGGGGGGRAWCIYIYIYINK